MLADRIKVSIPASKVKLAKELAVARNRKEKRFGAMTYAGKRGSLQAHLLGILPEMAAAHYYGVSVDDRIFEDHGDDGRDLILPVTGVTQLKATTYWSEPWLRAEVEHDHDGIDSYMLAYVDLEDFENVWLIGWLTRAEVISKPRRQLVDGGPLNYVASESELRPVPRPARHLLVDFATAARSGDLRRTKELMLLIESRMT